MRSIAFIALRIFAIYAGVCALIYLLQGWLLYHPPPESFPRGAQSILVSSGGVSVKVWTLHTEAPRALIYFGGNGEDVAMNLADFSRVLPDRAVYLVNYRGYSGNPGKPSETALIADAQAVYDAIKPHYEQIAVMGRSLGSGVATALATTRPAEKLILVTPFDSVANVAAGMYWWVPVQWLIRDRYDSAQRIRDISSHVLVIVAGRDDVIPRKRSDALAAAVPAQLRQVEIIDGATHNDISAYDEYWNSVGSFLKWQ